VGRDACSLEANMARGCLPTGEPLDALYGVGPWTPEPEPEPRACQCHKCGGRAYDLGDKIDCENCGEIEGEVAADVRHSGA
jgi:hypothetical protein